MDYQYESSETGPMRRPKHRNKQYFDHNNDIYGYNNRSNNSAGRSIEILHPNIQFLISCGVQKKYVHKLPFYLLNIMNPDYCGVCLLVLKSFAHCQEHYLSKSHYKNQKKFLKEEEKQHAKQDYTQLRKTYCELCDLNLTSMSHALSHYSGRPHNAIVFHGKPPKNTLLLTPDMQDRVNYLIESESMLCDINTVKVKSAKKTATVNKSQKLLCRTCNIYVSTQNEMVTHCNGKKHLTKEKGLILGTLHKESVDNESKKPPPEVKDVPNNSLNETKQDNNSDQVNSTWGFEEYVGEDW